MNTENKMKELKTAAWDAHNAHSVAEDSFDKAWKAYLNASEFLTAAYDAAQQAANAADEFEAGDYEALDYESEDK